LLVPFKNSLYETIYYWYAIFTKRLKRPKKQLKHGGCIHDKSTFMWSNNKTQNGGWQPYPFKRIAWKRLIKLTIWFKYVFKSSQK
jgi:hypothetical protein